MVSRHTSGVPSDDAVVARILYCDSRCTQTCHKRTQVCCLRTQVCPWRIQVHQGFPLVLPGFLFVLSVTLKASRNALLGSDTLLKLMHLS
jgi:hypothetical protein